MDLKPLRYFVAIVQSDSITPASLQLNVAQPALSLHIRNMESDLGVPLLFRATQGVQRTEAGHPHAQRSAPPRPVRGDAGRGGSAEPCGVARIGLPSSIAHILGVPLVLAARERHPKINLRIAEAMSGYVLDSLRLGRVDLVRTAGRARACPRRPRDPALADRALILPGSGHGLRDFSGGEGGEGRRLRRPGVRDQRLRLDQGAGREGPRPFGAARACETPRRSPNSAGAPGISTRR